MADITAPHAEESQPAPQSPAAAAAAEAGSDKAVHRRASGIAESIHSKQNQQHQQQQPVNSHVEPDPSSSSSSKSASKSPSSSLSQQEDAAGRPHHQSFPLGLGNVKMSASPPREPDPESGSQSGDENNMDHDLSQSHMASGGQFIEVKEQDRWLPIANVARIMKTALPDNAKIAKEAKECMQECVSEFISFITSEASEKCQQEKRKTVNGEDILFAMTSLGFENYSEALKIYLAKYRETQTNRTDNQSASGAGSQTHATEMVSPEFSQQVLASASANPGDVIDQADPNLYASGQGEY